MKLTEPELGQNSARTEPKLGQNWAKTRPELGQNSAKQKNKKILKSGIWGLINNYRQNL